MKLNKAIRNIMKETKTTQKKLMEAVNRNGGKSIIKSQSVIAERLKSDNLGIDKLLEMMDAMDYEIVLQPKSTRGKRAIGAYVINSEEEEQK